MFTQFIFGSFLGLLANNALINVGSEDFKPECCPGDEYLRDPFNCSVFYQCDNGSPRAKECPAPLCFKIWTGGICDYCENVPECMGSTTTHLTTTTVATTERTTKEPNKFWPCPNRLKRSTYLSHPKDCGKFYYCRKGDKIGELGICGDGLWFSLIERMCVDPWNDTCDIKTI